MHLVVLLGPFSGCRNGLFVFNDFLNGTLEAQLTTAAALDLCSDYWSTDWMGSCVYKFVVSVVIRAAGKGKMLLQQHLRRRKGRRVKGS